MPTSHEARARQLMTDPIGLFDQSITKMHTIPRDELDALQRTAMSIRFKEHYKRIEMLRNLADRLGITEVKEFNDLIPLLYPHTVFKSYPPSLLDKKRFDLMNQWLNKLTRYDISNVDVSGCDSIDAWINRMDEKTPLSIITSSGTTGTISLLPKSKAAAAYGMRCWRLFLFQTFGKEPTEEDLNPEVDIIWPNFASGKLGSLRLADWIKTEFTGGDQSRFHALYSDALDTDLTFLASKMKAAASRGELDRLKIDPKLLARKKEFEAMQARAPREMAEFLDKCFRELAGKRVLMIGSYNLLYDISAAGLKKGIKNVFAPNSAILTGGGLKGFAAPDNYMEIIREFLGVDRIQELYGMSEVGVAHWACDHGHYHVQPWCIPFVLDPDSNEPLPREGVQTGRAAFLDLVTEAHWGGSISGDEITIDWSTPCPCGLSTVHIHHNIIRYSEKQGVEDDRITCAAAHQVNEEVIDFMRGFES
jgi:hypothetical protein